MRKQNAEIHESKLPQLSAINRQFQRASDYVEQWRPILQAVARWLIYTAILLNLILNLMDRYAAQRYDRLTIARGQVQQLAIRRSIERGLFAPEDLKFLREIAAEAEYDDPAIRNAGLDSSQSGGSK